MSVIVVGVRDYRITQKESNYRGWVIETDSKNEVVQTAWSEEVYREIVEELSYLLQISTANVLKIFPPLCPVSLNEPTTAEVVYDFEKYTSESMEELKKYMDYLNNCSTNNAFNISTKLSYLLDHWNKGFVMFVERN